MLQREKEMYVSLYINIVNRGTYNSINVYEICVLNLYLHVYSYIKAVTKKKLGIQIDRMIRS